MKVQSAEQYRDKMRTRIQRTTSIPRSGNGANREMPRTITGGKPNHIERTYDDVGFYPIQCLVECD